MIQEKYNIPIITKYEYIKNVYGNIGSVQNEYDAF